MQFDLKSKSKIDLSDTYVPNLFVTNHMNNLEDVDIKVYIYMLYLQQNSIDIEDKEVMAKKLNISLEEIKASIDRLMAEELISRSNSRLLYK